MKKVNKSETVYNLR